MTMTTARHALPLIAPGQAQKEMFHNEAVAGIDALLHPAVEGVGATVPPADPAIGRSWLLGAEPSGAWTGQAYALAAWTDGGWRFHRPAGCGDRSARGRDDGGRAGARVRRRDSDGAACAWAGCVARIVVPEPARCRRSRARPEL